MLRQSKVSRKNYWTNEFFGTKKLVLIMLKVYVYIIIITQHCNKNSSKVKVISFEKFTYHARELPVNVFKNCYHHLIFILRSRPGDTTKKRVH